MAGGDRGGGGGAVATMSTAVVKITAPEGRVNDVNKGQHCSLQPLKQ